MTSPASPKKVLLILIVFYALNFMDRSVMAMVSEAMRLDLGLNDMQVGLCHSLLLISLVLLIIPCSALNDIFGPKRMIALAAGLWSLGMAGTGLAVSFPSLVAPRVLAGFNDAFTGSGGAVWLSKLYPPQKSGRVLGLFYMSVPVGMALGTLLGGLVLAVFGNWRLAFLCFVVPGVLVMLAIARLPGVKPAAGEPYWTGCRKVVRSRVLLLTGFAVGSYTILKFAYQAWLPTLIMRTYDLDGGIVGVLTSGMLLAGAIGPYLGGCLADHWQARADNGKIKAAIVCMLVMVASKVSFYLLIGTVGLPAICVFGLVDGVLTMTPLPIYFSLVQDVVPTRYRSLAIGVMGTLGFLTGGAWGPLLVGALSEAFGSGAAGLRLAMVALCAAGVLSVVFYACQLKIYLKEKAAVEM